MKAILFTTATKNIKYLEVILPKKGKDFYSENQKTLKKETEENRKDGSTAHVHGLEN